MRERIIDITDFKKVSGEDYSYSEKLKRLQVKEEVSQPNGADTNELLQQIYMGVAEILENTKSKYSTEEEQHILELETEKRELEFEKGELQSKCVELQNRVQNLGGKLKNCIPMHIIVYLVVNMGIISGTAILLFLYYGMHVYIIDVYYLICTLLMSLTLFLTALRSLKEWKRWVHE